MRKLLSAALVAGSLAFLALPAVADIDVKDVQIHQNATDSSVHLVLTNTDHYITQQGTMTITLMARPENGDWRVIKVWPDQDVSFSDHDLSFDAASSSSPALKGMLGHNWEAKVVIQEPHNVTLERTFKHVQEAATR